MSWIIHLFLALLIFVSFILSFVGLVFFKNTLLLIGGIFICVVSFKLDGKIDIVFIDGLQAKIYGYLNSTAKDYAIAHNLPFADIDSFDENDYIT